MIFGLAAPALAARVFLCGSLAFLCFLHPANLRAADLSFTNLMAQGQLRDQQQDTRAALEFFLQAEKLAPTNAEVLFLIAKQYCDLMHTAKSDAEKKECAALSVAYGRRAAADPQSPKTHVCLAICYAKNFPYLTTKPKSTTHARSKSRPKKPSRWTPKTIFPTTCWAGGTAKSPI